MWPTVSFNDIIRTSQNGFGARRGDGQPNVVLRLADVDSESWNIASSDLRQIGMRADDLAKYSLNHGDLLVVRVNGSPAIAGRVVPYAGPAGYAFCDHFIRFQLVEHVDPRFIAHQFRHRRVRSQVERAMVSTAGQYTVSQRTFASVAVELPPLDEQHRVVAAIETHFSRLDAAVASLTRAQANVKRARASVLKAAVEGRLVPTEAALARAEGRDYEPASVLLGRILAERRAAWAASGARGKYKEPVGPETEGLAGLPEGWVYCRIDTVGRVQLGRQRSPKNHEGPNMRPYLRVANVFEARIDLSDVMEMNFTEEEFVTYRIHPGDILLNEGQSPHLVGRPALWSGQVPDMCFTNSLVRFQADPGVLPAYALAVFRAQLAARRYMKLVTITTNIAHLGAQRFAAVEFPLPPLPEQHRIAAEVDRRLSVLDALDATLDRNLARCARLRQSILKRAFEGRLEEPDATQEPLPATSNGWLLDASERESP